MTKGSRERRPRGQKQDPQEEEESLIELWGGGLSGAVESSKTAGGSLEDTLNEAGAGGGVAPAAVAGGGGGYTLAEVAKHTTKADWWGVVGGQVLDDTKILSECAGVELAIVTVADHEVEVKDTSPIEFSGGGFSGAGESSKMAGGSLEDTLNNSCAGGGAAALAVETGGGMEFRLRGQKHHNELSGWRRGELQDGRRLP